MAKTKTVDGTDFHTYQAIDNDRHSGWNWYCLHCTADAGRGVAWRSSRVDARKNARSHAGTHQGGAERA